MTPEKIIPKLDGSPILVTLARLEKRKGHSYVLTAIAKLKNEYPNILYVIAGSGEELGSLQEKVRKFDIEKNVLFVGNINNNEKNYLFKKTNLMLMPTTDESGQRSIEGFGIAYLEAAFYGIPSLASNIGGTPEAVLHEETGLILKNTNDMYSALQNILSDHKKLEAIAHEKVHMNQMERGDLEYDDDNVYWKGETYPRDEMEEGAKNLPWEKEAWKANKEFKKQNG